ncbi:MAG: thioredoxin domain-containing protein [Planctomycetes bacterium]|nr:thioredoxin domain-containing protein [Planctomycetota bacterium]
MANRLAHETSPYLLQHAHNPVDWFPWGQEALAQAKAEDKPIFLSIGYAACHWCHVMEHESFENEAIARLMNEGFINVKVDREERPDLDQIYMNAVQALTGHGGWPMSVFLTHDLKPFYGGTYWPPSPRGGMPGFDQVLRSVGDAWKSRRKEIDEHADELTKAVQSVGVFQKSEEGVRPELLEQVGSALERVFDFTHGGFGRAPKFPHAMDLQVLLRVWRRNPRRVWLDMVKLNLDKMAQGGIYDHLAGGFARYSVDERWLVPHFEKMLYDNALLTGAYLDGWLVTRNEKYARVVRETLDYILNYMTGEEGGFHSTEDADSEGEEGKFYVWSPAEIREVLGPEEAERFCYVYDVTEEGNFEGKNILNLPKTIEQVADLRGWDLEELRSTLTVSRQKLLEHRDQRIRPGKDDKVLTSWNALMIDAMARAAAALGEPRYLAAATRAAEFLMQNLRRDDGRLLHTWRGGIAKLDAYLDDYAYLTNALVSLYEAGFDERWIDEAVRLADTMLKRFRDREDGGFYYTADDHEQLIARNKDLIDSSVPSGNGMAATALMRLGKLCGRADYVHAAYETLELAVPIMERSPTAAGQMLIALDMHLGPFHEIVILGDREQPDTRKVLDALCRSYIPNRVVAQRNSDEEEHGSAAVEPIFIGKTLEPPEPTVYICQRFACQTPVRGRESALARWKAMGASPIGD